MSIFNLNCHLEQLRVGQLREFDASKFEKVVQLKEGFRLQLEAPLVSSLVLPNGRLACVTNSTFQIFDVHSFECLSKFNFNLHFNEVTTKQYQHSEEPVVSSVHLLPGGDKVLICGITPAREHGSTQVWDIVHNRCLLKTPEGPHVLSNAGALETFMQPGWLLKQTTPFDSEYGEVYPNDLRTIANSARPRISTQNLRTIDVELGPLEHEDVLPLLEAMIHSSDVLKHLSLKGLKLNEDGFGQLLKLVETNTRLKTLNLEETCLTNKQVVQMKTTWAQKKRPPNRLIFFHSEISSNLLDLSQPIFPPSLAQFSDLQPIAKNLDDPPPSYVCCITHEIMFSPVFDALGYSYEEEAIQKHFLIKTTSPQTNEDLPNQNLTPDRRLQSDIRNYLDNNPDQWENVYLPQGNCTLVKTACHQNNAEQLLPLLKHDRRLLTRLVITNRTKFLLEALCEEASQRWTNLFPLVVNMLKPKEWRTLLTHKPIEEWLRIIATTNMKVCPQGLHPAISFFITQIQSAFAKEINFIELALYALQENHQPLFHLCLSQKFQSKAGLVNQPVDNFGNTLLHLAAQQGRTEMVNYLLNHGGNIKIRNYENKKPETLARDNGHTVTADTISAIKVTPLLDRLGILDGMRQLKQLQQQVELLKAQVEKSSNFSSTN